MEVTVEYIQRELNRLRAIAGDDEAAHSKEDALRHKVLVAIADGAPDPARLAAEVLKSGNIEFARWCA